MVILPRAVSGRGRWAYRKLFRLTPSSQRHKQCDVPEGRAGVAKQAARMWKTTIVRLLAAVLVCGWPLAPAGSFAQTATVTPTITPTPTVIPPVTLSLPNAFIPAVLGTTEVSLSITDGIGIIAYNLGITFDPTIVH